MNDSRFGVPRRGGSSGGGLLSALLRHPKILAALAVLVISYITFKSKTREEVNAFTKEEVTLALTPEQEVQLGLQALGEMERQFGGEVNDQVLKNDIKRIGDRLLAAKEEILKKRGDNDFDYQFQFHVLADNKTINAFALPGGQVFITMGLINALNSVRQTESRRLNVDAVAGVLGHEIGHVLAQHSNQQIAKSTLLQGIASAAAIATSSEQSNGQMVGQMVGQLLQTKYGREAESQSDRIGVQLMIVAGYDPEQMLTVMAVLKESMKGGARGPEILSTHPFPETRAKQLRVYIDHFRKDPYGTWDGEWK